MENVDQSLLIFNIGLVWDECSVLRSGRFNSRYAQKEGGSLA